jgi:hypothetical protein
VDIVEVEAWLRSLFGGTAAANMDASAWAAWFKLSSLFSLSAQVS